MDLSDLLGLAVIGVDAIPGLSMDQKKLAAAGIKGAVAILKAKRAGEGADEKLQKSWVKIAKKLEKKKDMDNEFKIAYLKQKVRADLTLRNPKHNPPSDNTVTTLAEGAVAIAKIDG